MAQVKFTKENMPKTREEFQRALKEAMAQSNPVDDLLSLSRELSELERQYAMTSETFFEKYSRGELGDAMPFIKWAGRYQLYLNLKGKIEKSLERVISA